MFRFTIRDVLWLMVVVAVLMAWWLDRSILASQDELAKKFIALMQREGRSFEPGPDGTWIVGPPRP